MAVDTCPERVDAAYAEAPRIETAVEFWSGVEVRMQAVVDNYPKRMQAVDNCPERMHTAGLTMKFFWRARKKKQEAAGAC